MSRVEGLMFLRVEVIADYGDTCLIAVMTPLDQANRHGGHMRIRPTSVVAKADLVADPAPIVQRTKPGSRSKRKMALPDSRLATCDLAPAPEVPPC
ncbi:MAG: hypothetical protein KJZ65_06520 [Phycisphaerales bacterium]|nr:hypothetical protein [Phycisphaerales bacterium]